MTEPKIFVSEGAGLDREVSPAHKLAHERVLKSLGEASMHRQSRCWMFEANGCGGTPSVHVNEVGFDFRDVNATSRVAMLSTKDIKGPVPGFCAGCVAIGPPLLAEAVYNTRRETRFGVKMNRWFMRFTDGSSLTGSCEPFAMNGATFTYTDRATS